ncbi:unnamed protein product, partial [Discosporangium mesarthrocarpum]
MRVCLVHVLIGLGGLTNVALGQEEPVVGFWNTRLWNQEGTTEFTTDFMPPRWNSTYCMKRNGYPQLQHELDPSGYLLVGRAREQLGGVKWAFKDMLHM